MKALLHKLYGGIRLVCTCRDWRSWLKEYFSASKDGRPQCYRFRNGAFLKTRRNGMDLHMIDEIWCFRKYDRFGFRVAPGETVLEIGAHIGAFTVYAATACQAGRIIAFEPHPDNFRLLTENVTGNGLSCVTCVNEAVAGVSAGAFLEIHPTNSGGHRLLSTSTDRTIQVSARTLSDLCDRHDLPRIDYVKLDCEGAEYDILLHTPSAVLRRIRRISMEYHDVAGHTVSELEQHLTEHRFSVRGYGDHRLYAKRID